MIRARSSRLIAFLALAAAALAGCATSSDGPVEGPDASNEARTSEGENVTGELTVFAAASLQAAFDEIAADFEAENPGIDVNPIVYDGSSTLATQIQEGAEVDVFASADEANMEKVGDLAVEPVLFAANTLVLVTPAGNPGGIETLADLADPGKLVVLCAEEVPCGAASATLLENAGLEVSADSYEQNVTAVLTKVAAGEADAGLVYATDVAGRDDVEHTTPDGADDVVNRYPISVLTAAAAPDAAALFVEFVTGEKGQSILRTLGFGAP
jgi:molybdate transport system substrate-binding protein